MDAPVSGASERAAQGKLSIIVGGDQSAYEESLPVLQAMGSNVVHVGASGIGNVIKLVNNAVLITNLAVAAEGFNLGVQLGADPQTLLDIVSKSTGQSFAIEWMTTSLSSRDFETYDGPLMRLILKDVDLVSQAANEVGVSMPISGVAFNLFKRFSTDWPDISDPAGVLLALEQDNHG